MNISLEDLKHGGEHAKMRALLISYHFAVVDLINAYNDGAWDSGGDEVEKLEAIAKQAEPFARKHEGKPTVRELPPGEPTP